MLIWMSECDRDNLFIVILAATNRWASPEGYLWPHLREGTGVTIRSRHPECSECLNVFEQNADKVTSKIPFATWKEEAIRTFANACEDGMRMKVAAIAHLHFTCMYCMQWDGMECTSLRASAIGSMHPYIHQIKHAHMYISVDGD